MNENVNMIEYVSIMYVNADSIYIYILYTHDHIHHIDSICEICACVRHACMHIVPQRRSTLKLLRN